MPQNTRSRHISFYRIDPDKEEFKIDELVWDEFSSIILGVEVMGTVIRVDRSFISKDTKYLIKMPDGSIRSRSHHWLGKKLEEPDLIFKELLNEK